MGKSSCPECEAWHRKFPRHCFAWSQSDLSLLIVQHVARETGIGKKIEDSPDLVDARRRAEKMNIYVNENKLFE